LNFFLRCTETRNWRVNCDFAWIFCHRAPDAAFTAAHLISFTEKQHRVYERSIAGSTGVDGERFRRSADRGLGTQSGGGQQFSSDLNQSIHPFRFLDGLDLKSLPVSEGPDVVCDKAKLLVQREVNLAI
jgi:hypothetical protein